MDVIYKLSNGKYCIVQCDTTGKIGLSDAYNALEEASLKNFGNWVESFYVRHTYIFGFYDCQNFSREVVQDINGRKTGILAFEDGPTFGKKCTWFRWNR